MATTNKFFKVKNGLDVNSNATVDASGNANIAGNLTANAGFVSADTFRLDTSYTGGSAVVGEFSWDPDFETARLLLDGVNLQIGQEHVVRVKNASVSVAIPDRTLVMFAGSTGDTVTVSPAISSNIATYPSDYMLGITTEEIPADGFGFVTQFGFINNVNTTAWTVGTLLYADPATAGGFVASLPTAPSWRKPIAAVTRQHATTGRIFVRAVPGEELKELDDVQITSPANNQVLTYSSGVWINANAAGGSGNSFETISANGTSVVADSSTDTLTFSPIDGLTITGNATSDTITFGVNPAGMLNRIVDGTSGNSYGLVGTSAYLDVKDTNGYNKEIELDIAAVESKLTTDGFVSTSGATFTGNVAGTNISLSGDIAVNGGNITTSQTTATLYNTTATTVHIGNAANVTLGNITHAGNVTVNNDLVVYGNIIFNNGASELSATTIQVDDTLISLSDNNAADTSDIGFYAGYKVSTVDYHTGLVRDASDKVWNLFSNVAQPTGTVDFTNAVYDTLKLGNVISTSSNSNATVQLIPGYTSTAAVIQLGNKSNVASTPGIIFNSGTTGSNVYDASISASGGNASTGNGNLSIHANVITIGNASSNTSTVNVAGSLIVYSDVRAANIRNPFGAQLNVISTAYPMLIEAVDGITLSGNVTYKTHTAGTNNNLLASTSYVDNAILSPFLLMGG